MLSRLHSIRRAMGWAGLVFLLLFTARFVLARLGLPESDLLRLAMYAAGIWLVLRLIRLAFRRGIWRLRNRLLAAYLFMAVVPILLIATLAAFAVRAIASQLAVYLVTSELDRRIEGLRLLGESLAKSGAAERRIDPVFRNRYPDLAVLLREFSRETRYPPDAVLPAPTAGWGNVQGVIRRDDQYFLWSHQQTPTGDVTITAPLTPEFFSALVPHIGQIGFGTLSRVPGQRLSLSPPGTVPASRLPAPFDFFDPEVRWFAAVPKLDWDHPAERRDPRADPLIVAVRSRATALAAAMYNPNADLAQGVLLAILALLTGVFVIVELAALVIGVRLTRSMTGAVHRLYQGTQRAIEGDFSHRIQVRGRDQLAELSHSFNRMTESIQHLLVVAKEKERLQSEMEIASEVQNRLYPRGPVTTSCLRVSGVCRPARVVSGDYFDYESLHGGRVLLAMGDVAGKGISAALLMASLQSSLRTQLSEAEVSVSQLVNRVNQQLHVSTAPEKFATFCAGIFDEAAGVFTYTNAGHLP